MRVDFATSARKVADEMGCGPLCIDTCTGPTTPMDDVPRCLAGCDCGEGVFDIRPATHAAAV